MPAASGWLAEANMGARPKEPGLRPRRLRETGAAVAVTVFRPSEDQAVLVVAAADPEAVEAQLRPQLGQLLCVVPSTPGHQRWFRLNAIDW
jgi:hypothetical protein